MEESKTYVQIIDETIGLSAGGPDYGVNVLCPVISPNGPIALTKVSTPTELRNLYNAGSAITPSSETSLKYARALLNYGPIYIKRASRNRLFGGTTFGSMKTSLFVDENDNIIDGQIVKFGINTDYDNYMKKLSASTGVSSVRTSDTTFVSTADFRSSIITGIDSELLKSYSKFEVSPDNIIIFGADSEETVKNKLTVTIGSAVIDIEANETVEKATETIITAIKNLGGAITPVNIYGSGYMLKTYNGYNFTKGETTEVAAIAFSVPVKIVAYNDTSGESITSGAVRKFASTDLTSTYDVYLYTLKTKSEYIEEKVISDLDVILKIDAGSSKYDYIYIYNEGIATEVATAQGKLTDADNVIDIVVDSDDNVTFKDLMLRIVDEVNAVTTIDTHSSSSFVIQNCVSAESGNINTNTVVKVLSTTDIVTPGLDAFGIISKFPNSSAAITVELSEISGDVYTINISYKNITEEWEFSLEDGAVDGYGNDINYRRVNRNSELIKIIPIGGPQAELMTAYIGNEITGDLLTVTDMISGLDYIDEYEESPVLFDYIADGGVIDSSLSQKILNMCETYLSFYPASCPTGTNNKAKFTQSRGRFGSDWHANFVAAAQADAFLDNGIETFPGSLYYIGKRLELASSVNEFAPLFGPSNGDINITDPAISLKKSDREALLDSQIITLRRSMATGSWYLNDNLTCYKTDSYLQEDGIALMILKASQLAKVYAETLKGQYNTGELRARVANYLTTMISSRLRVGSQNGPLSVTVVCNDTNNTAVLINQRKLRIDIYARFTRSIKDVLIYSHVQPLEE